MMFGYASNETPEYLPMPIALAHRLARRLAEVRKSGELSYLRPDGKTQVTVEYEDGKPVRVDTIVISTQHDPDVTQAKIHDDMVKHVIEPTIPAKFLAGYEVLHQSDRPFRHRRPAGGCRSYRP